MKPPFLFLFASLVFAASAVAQTYSVTADSTTYSSAAGQLTFNVTLTYPSGAIPSIAAKPPGADWTFVSVSGTNVPTIQPLAGIETTDPSDPDSAFNFTYSSPPAGGTASFSFVISYPAAMTGNKSVTFVADYRLNGVRTVVPVSTIVFAPSSAVSAAPVISSATTATATVGTAFSYQITASNNPTSYAATGLPAGLSINTTSGLISGTPTTAGSSTVALSAINGGGSSASFSLTLTVNSASSSSPYIVTATPSTYSSAAGQLTFNVTLTYPSGAIPSIAAKPPGGDWAFVSVSGTNVPTIQPLAGIETTDPSDPDSAFNFTYSSPPAGGTASFSFVISYPAAMTGNKSVTFVADYRLNGVRTVVPVSAIVFAPAAAVAPAPVISSATTATATVGTAFSYQITASNSPTSYAATGLPAGLSINTTSGLISGTPTTAGTSTVTLTATNSGGTSSALSLVLTVNPAAAAPTISTQPQSQTVTAGSPVTFTVVANGSSPLSYQWKKGTVEIAGATNASYTIQSTVSADAGSYFVTVTNPGGSLTSNAASLTVTAAVPVPVISSAATATATVGTAFSYQITASNSPTSYAATGLPAGLSINTTTGLISGTPTAAGTSTVTLTATNTGGTSSPFVLALTFTASSSGFAFSQQPAAITRNRGETASLTVNTTGGTGTVTYKWYKDGNALSDSFGRIAGSSSAMLVISNVGAADAGSYSATATTVQNGTINSTGAALTVLAGPTITRAALDSSAQVNGSVSFSVSATGSGTLSYKWLFTAKNSSLPVQISDVSGRFAGSATSTLVISAVASGDEGFYTCEVTDSAGVARSSGYLSVVSRIIRVVSQSAAPGSNVTVVVQLLATGVENAAGFSLQFDSSKLTYVAASAVLGAQASDATLVPNEVSATQGRLGFAIAKPANAAWQAGTNELLKLTFSLKSTLTSVDFCVIGFGQSPVAQEVVGVDALVLPTGFSAGVITPLAGFEADINGSGTVTISDWVKIGRIVAGLDPRPTGVDFLKADCAPRLNTDSTLRLGGGTLSIADWVQAGRYAAGLDPLTAVGGPTDTQNP